MRESMVSLERRVHHASEAVVPLERGVIRSLERRPVQVAWPGVCMAEKSNQGTRRPAGVKGGPIAITGGVVMRWQRKACGA